MVRVGEKVWMPAMCWGISGIPGDEGNPLIVKTGRKDGRDFIPHHDALPALAAWMAESEWNAGLLAHWLRMTEASLLRVWAIDGIEHDKGSGEWAKLLALINALSPETGNACPWCGPEPPPDQLHVANDGRRFCLECQAELRADGSVVAPALTPEAGDGART